MDIRKTITPKSDQLNSDDLIAGSITIKIREVKVLDIETQPLHVFFEGDNNKPYKPSKGMRRVLVQLYGSEDTAFIGKSLTLYRDDTVKYGGDEVGGIRISHASGITEPMRALETISKGKRRAITIQPLEEQPVISDVESLSKLNECKTAAELKACYLSLEKVQQKLPTVVALTEKLKTDLI